MSQPPWDGSGQQDPRQYQGQPQQPYGQATQWQEPPYPGQQPGYMPPPGRPPRESWVARHKVLTGLIAVIAVFIVGSIGAAAGKGSGTAAPAPTVTVTQIQHDPGSTATVTVTATPTANAQGEATQISDDGVYVVGQDIPGGTWHTSGGSQCYEANLSGTDTIHDIISNNNFTGPNTVSLVGAKAFNISGGCTWSHES
jgi:hypothetical protein